MHNYAMHVVCFFFQAEDGIRDVAVTGVQTCALPIFGFDVRKFRELRQYLDERNLQKPVLGNVYVLGLKAAEKMSTGEPPGCWVAPELVETIQDEVKAKDKGEAARLERAARMVAILRGLGYAGA